MDKRSVKVSISYFLVHLLVEVVSFAVLYNYFPMGVVWAIALLYDALAFVTQGLFGILIDQNIKFDVGVLGILLMGASLFFYESSNIIPIIIGTVLVALGNACLHECGAVSTVATGNGKLFPVALFVSGGSFGLIIGQIMGKDHAHWGWLIMCLGIALLLVLFTNRDWRHDLGNGPVEYPKYDIVKKEIAVNYVILIAFMVTAVRSFLGYAIPIGWKKELWQTVFLFVMMGIGKAIGGLFVDVFGARRTGLLATLLSIPFLVFGNNFMIVSIIGVLFFSMTMSITYGMLLSVIGDMPGLMFGITTIGLFAGLVPVFIAGTFGLITNIILVIVLSMACFIALYKTLKNK